MAGADQIILQTQIRSNIMSRLNFDVLYDACVALGTQADGSCVPLDLHIAEKVRYINELLQKDDGSLKHYSALTRFDQGSLRRVLGDAIISLTQIAIEMNVDLGVAVTNRVNELAEIESNPMRIAYNASEPFVSNARCRVWPVTEDKESD
jgi:hypothetical protein